MNGFLWYYTGGILRRVHIWLLLGMAIWRFWRFGDHQQNGLVYSDATNLFMNTLVWVHEWNEKQWRHRYSEGSNSQTYLSACNDMPERMMADSYMYTAFCELCYSTKGQFATVMLLKPSTKSGACDIRKTNREDSQGLRYSFISPANRQLFSSLCVRCPSICLCVCLTIFQNLSSTISGGLLSLNMNAVCKRWFVNITKESWLEVLRLACTYNVFACL